MTAPGGDAELGPDAGAEPPRSGLRNPRAAVNGVGMATLLCEFLVILLAIQPIRIISPETSGSGLAIVAICAVLCLIATATLRLRWGWPTAVGLQVVLIVAGVSGLAHWMLTAVGIIFLLVWGYLYSVRRTVIGGSKKLPDGGE